MTPPAPVLTVTPNPALDTTYTVAELHPGLSHRVPAPIEKAGGKGLNVARVIQQSGFGVHAVLPVGGDSGVQLRTDLEDSGLPHSLVEVAQPTRRSIAIYDRTAGTATLLNEEGRELTAGEWAALSAGVLRTLQHSGCLVGSGSLPLHGPESFYADLVRHARRLDIPAVIDTSGPALLAAARAGAMVLKPNHHELLEATGETAMERGAEMLLALGAGLVLVSRGEEGMYAFTSDDAGTSSWHARFPRVLSGNATGAGDAAVAAIAVLLAQGIRTVPDLVRAATGWSASAVLMPTAGVLHADYNLMTDAVVVRPGRVRPPTPPAGTAPAQRAKDSPWD
ncbi:hexose kinase [Vibrio cholerae]|nr:hexose kinase [Vibrio cholerae]